MQQILQMFGKDRLWIIRDQIITIMAITITITTAAMAAVAMEITAAGIITMDSLSWRLSGFPHCVVYHEHGVEPLFTDEHPGDFLFAISGKSGSR